jgi:serine phosphatase RsbU (regulator of sigma subunit)
MLAVEKALMEIQIGSAKVSKYAVQESGDTLEIIERPQGGFSVVLVDGQRSGRSAKLISNIVARKAISLLGEGVRDGATARASHDYLRTHRGGQVSADLQIISIDLVTRTIVISRNTPCPALVIQQGRLTRLDAPSEPIGIHVNTKPVIVELPLEAGLCVVAFTDGLAEAGERSAQGALDIPALVTGAQEEGLSAQGLADALLEYALVADQRRPHDDMSVLVLRVDGAERPDGVRRLSVSVPL